MKKKFNLGLSVLMLIFCGIAAYCLAFLPFIVIDFIMCIINSKWPFTKHLWTAFREDEFGENYEKIFCIREFGLFLGLFAIIVWTCIDALDA